MTLSSYAKKEKRKNTILASELRDDRPMSGTCGVFFGIGANLCTAENNLVMRLQK